MATVELLVIVYGSCSRDPNNDDRFEDVTEQRRVEITLNPVIPANLATSLEKKSNWIMDFTRKIGQDMKHNRNWRCEFCNIHARETVWMKASWMHLDPPRMVCYVHHLCDTATGPCADKIRAVDAEMRAQTGLPPAPLPQTAPPAGYVYPMAATCAVCNEEATKSRKNLKQCAKCGLTRYCRCVSVEIAAIG
ncbi:hypothetical protein DFH06DRAFT_1227252 [Mycena polygramma]|nr:hypothetical protein DFH06DRAFT_1227252 [Mycena polygramma]